MKKSLSLRRCVSETHMDCVLWAAQVDFFIVTVAGSKHSGSSEGGRDSRLVKVEIKQAATQFH